MILSTGGMSASVHAGIPPPGSRHPPRKPHPPTSRHPLKQTSISPGADPPKKQTPCGSRHPPKADPPGADPPGSRHPLRSKHPPGADPSPREADCGIRSTSGRYASYWNAFLFNCAAKSLLWDECEEVRRNVKNVLQDVHNFSQNIFRRAFQIPNDYFSNETLLISFTFRTKIGPGQGFHEAATLGRRYTAKESLEAGIVQAVTREADVLPDAKQMARKAIADGGYKRKSLLNMKKDIYNSLFDLQDDQDRRPFLRSAI